MCRRLVSILVLIASVIVLAALPSAGAPSANDASIASSEATAPTSLAAPSTPIQVTLDMDRAPALGEVANVTASVTSVLPAPGTTLQIEVPAGAEVVSGETAWAGDLEEGEQVDLSLSLRFVQEGEWTIAATALRPVDADNTWGDVAQVFITVKSDSGQFGRAAPAEGLSHTEEQLESDYVRPSEPAATPEPGYEEEDISPVPPGPDKELPPGALADQAPDPPPDASPGSVTVWGYLRVCDRDNVVRGLPNVKVELWDSDTIDDDKLAYTFTDANGRYQFPAVNNEEDPWPFTSRQDVYIVAHTETDQRLVESQDFPYNDYRWSSHDCCKQNNVPDGTVRHPDVQISCDSANRGAMWIFLTLYDGWAFPPHSIGHPGSVTVQWDSDSTDGDHYHNKWLLGGGEVHLTANAACSRDTIIHEAGHAYMDNVYSNYPDFNCPSPHFFCGASSLNCGWGEGWADFLPVAVYQDQHYNWAGTYHPGGGACGTGGSRNVETIGSCDTGDTCEGRVAGALLDIFDSNDDGHDHYDGGFYDIWDTFYNQDDSRFRYFWDAWKARGHNKHDVVQAIFQNTIDYDTAPTLSGIPDRSLNEDTSWNNAIDLWVHASDPESYDSQLDYTIIANTAPNCGVSIDSGDYIDIDPADDWCGYCDVTARASDGVKSDTDQFRVTVNCIPDAPTISGVPQQVVNQDSSLDNAVWLNDYTSDPDGHLSYQFDYSITGNTNPDVGVSIDTHCFLFSCNYYIDINPTPGWSGSSDVTVRVTDPDGLWDEDTFNVTINAPPTISGLPDRSLDRDSSLDNTILLNNYVSDELSLFMIYTKTADTNPDAGVSIDSHQIGILWYHYIDINPTPGWCGDTDVTIRAADIWGLWDEDTFHVKVNCVGVATWSAWQSLGGTLSGQVSAAATASDDVYVFGVNAAGKPYYRHWNGTSWEAWAGLGGTLSSNLSAVAAGSDVYVFGLGGGGRPYYNRLSGGSWSGWQSLGGRLTGQLSAAATASDDVYVFGVNAAGKPYYRHWNGTSWDPWSSMGGTLTSPPTAVVAGTDIYVFGLGGGGVSYYKRLSGGSWSAWQSLGGTLSGQLSAAAPGSGSVYMFGTNAAGKPYFRHWNGTSWDPWSSMGGTLSTSPTAVAAGSDVYVFGLGGSGRPYYNRLSGGSWSGWQSLGGTLSGQLSAAATASNDVYVFGLNAAGRLWYRHYG